MADLPDIPDEARMAAMTPWVPGSPELVAQQTSPEVVAAVLVSAWPHLYAAALEDFADRMDRVQELAGYGDDPFGFVAASARTLAHDAREGIA